MGERREGTFRGVKEWEREGAGDRRKLERGRG